MICLFVCLFVCLFFPFYELSCLTWFILTYPKVQRIRGSRHEVVFIRVLRMRRSISLFQSRDQSVNSHLLYQSSSLIHLQNPCRTRIQYGWRFECLHCMSLVATRQLPGTVQLPRHWWLLDQSLPCLKWPKPVALTLNVCPPRQLSVVCNSAWF